MRIFLILLTLSMVSCGKENFIGSNKPRVLVDQKSFLTINDEAATALFRSNILNAIVEKELPSSTNIHEVGYREELQEFSMTEKDLKSYKEKEATMAKVVVSFPERTEIYFLPEGVFVSDLVEVLELSEDSERVFKLITSDDTKTYKGGVFYLVSLNHNDLMVNDKKFFQTTLHLKNDFNKRQIPLDPNRVFKIDVDYNFYKETLTTQAVTKPAPLCTVELIEAGMCGPCHYREGVGSGHYEKTQVRSLSDLGFKVSVNGKDLPLTEIGSLTKEGSVHIDIPSFEIYNSAVMFLSTSSSPVYYETYESVDFLGACQNVPKTKLVNFQSRAEFSVTVNIWGRGEELKVIKL